MQTSESIQKLSKALLNFQTKMDVIKKEDENPFFKSKYAGLPSILEAIKKPLQDSGLSITQHPEGKSSLTTMLVHGESGEYIMSTLEMSPKEATPQAVGSAITYARRYALGAILGLNIDDDDDGNAASQTTPAKRYEVKNTDAKCAKCGAGMSISKTTGKPYCSQRCWLPENQHLQHQEEIPVENIPF